MLYHSVDEDGDGFISREEIIRTRTKVVDEDGNEESGSESNDDQENFIERLVKAVTK